MSPATAAVSPIRSGGHVLDGILPHPGPARHLLRRHHAVANAGLLLAATLAERLGIEQTADALIDLGERPGAHRPGRKLLTLVHTMIAGGGCIDDADVLRCGATSRVLGHRVMAPSTVGTFLRAFGLAEIPEVRHAERLFGDPDYLLRVASADIAAYQTLRDQKLATLPGVGRLTSTIVMKRVVDERPFPLAPASPRPHPKCR